MVARILRKIVNWFIRMKIHSHVKRYIKKGIHPTTRQVIQDIGESALNTLTQYGYSHKEINKMIEDIIRRQTCKGQNALMKKS